MKKIIKRILLVIAILLLTVIISGILFFLIGRTLHKMQTNIKTSNGVQETVTIEVNGIKEQLSIRGENQSNPVILFLHGGPGSPTGCFDYLWEPYLNDQFTIVTYAQRGCGRTYYDNPNAEISRELVLQDIDKTVDYLRERFGQDKIIIMGHSWGTLIGTLYVQGHPEKVSSYIGVGQAVNTFAGEDIAFNEALRRATEADDREYVSKITKAYKAFCVTHKVDNDFFIYRNMEPKYLRGIREKTFIKMYLEAATSPDMNLQDMKWHLIDSSKILMAEDNTLTQELFYFDANEMLNYKVPMYFISGGNDYITPFSAVQSYYEKITAPDKNMIIIDGAGHNTFIDVPKEFAETVKQLILKNNWSNE